MSKYGLGGCDLPNKRVIGGQVGANRRLVSGKQVTVGLGKGQALGLNCSSSMSTTTG